jgi:hypothetical protein
MIPMRETAHVFAGKSEWPQGGLVINSLMQEPHPQATSMKGGLGAGDWTANDRSWGRWCRVV